MPHVKEEVLLNVDKDENVPAWADIPNSVGRLRNTAVGSTGTVFIASVEDECGTKHPVLFSAGHIFAVNKVLPSDINLADYSLEFENQPPFTLRTLAEKLHTTTVIWYGGTVLIKENNFTLQQDTSSSSLDAFVMITHDEDDEPGSALNVVTSCFQLRPLPCGDNDYLQPSPGQSIIVFGYPGVGPRKQATDLRFSMGIEVGFEEVAKSLGDHLERIKQLPRFPGECKTKCDPIQNCEYCDISLELTKLNNPEARSQRIFYQNDTLPGNSGSPVLSSGNRSTSSMAYSVKGIHVEGAYSGKANAAQSLEKVLPVIKSYF